MMISAWFLCMCLSAICVLLAALGIPSRVNLALLGAFFWLLSQIVP